MKTRIESDSRGRTQMAWLDSRHSFSFGNYLDPERMGFRSLRVLNDDRVEPGAGFPTHPHRDMEILTYVLDGTIAHEDSIGHRTELNAGEMQRMSAGQGVTHSEFNASGFAPLHFLQIWIVPERSGIEPSYEQRPIGAETGFELVASRGGRDGSMTIHQDVDLYLLNGATVEFPLRPERHAYVHVATGEATVNGETLKPGDALEISDEDSLHIEASEDGRVLIFDLA